ncbi:MAG: N-formylglutamate deformylase [Alphaproteobacteria bacterium]|nr:N-formylglutamate deformylase [Alphaproteobacteria bacterium]
MSTPPLFHLSRGSAPLLVSFPHSGTYVPPDIAARMTDTGKTMPDTDWHVPQLYKFLDSIGASRIEATHSRYVVDLNRPPDDKELYAGQKKTGLVPTDTFKGEPLYRDGEEPTGDEIAARSKFWKPYHETLAQELSRVKAIHGTVILWDAHSIESVLPSLFEGRLPDLNLGTFDGKACDADVIDAVFTVAKASGFSAVLNDRFKGGYITRHYGDRRKGINAIQLEMAQSIYMDEGPPFTFRPDRATKVTTAIRAMIAAALEAL